MDHNQTITDLFLQKHLSEKYNIVTVDLYESIKSDLKPQLELAEFRVELRAWFDGPLNKYMSSKRVGIRLTDESARAPKTEYMGPPVGIHKRDNSDAPDFSIDPDETKEEEESLTIYITPSMRLFQPDPRNWAMQKRGENGVWVNQYYHNSLDALISSFIRHSLNGKFKVSPNKITELKELVKVIQSVKESLEETFKAIIVEKTGDKAGEQAA